MKRLLKYCRLGGRSGGGYAGQRADSQGAVAVSGEPPRRRLAAPWPSPGGLDQVVHEQQLSDRQRLAALAALQLAQGFRQFGALAESGPDRLLEQPAVLVRHVAVDMQRVHGAAVLVAG